MKLYVINLDRSPDRLHHIDTLFRRQGLELTRIAAIDANFISPDTYHRLTARLQWPESLTMGEVACFLSHRLVLQKIAEGTDPYAAVFEDDVILSPRAHLFLNTTDWIPQDADIIKTETQKKRVWLGVPQSLSGNVTIARLKSTHLLSAGYIISREAAAQLIQESEYVNLPLDYFLFSFRHSLTQKRIIYQLDPAIVMQAALPSQLKAERAKRKQNRTRLQTLRRKTNNMRQSICQEFLGLGIKLATKEQWKRVPFDEQE